MTVAASCSYRPARPSPDFFGGERLGDNAYANSLVALRADTGAARLASAARASRFVGLRRRGAADARRHRARRQIDPAVVQATKTGLLFVFDRETGEPVFEIIERPVPASDVPGETAVADATVSRDAGAGLARSSHTARCLGPDVLRSRQVSLTHRALSLRGHLHAAELARHDSFAELRRRCQLGQPGVRQRAPARARRRQSRTDCRHSDSALQFAAAADSGSLAGLRFRPQQPAPHTACAAKCCSRRWVCLAPRLRGERSPPSTCVATQSAGRFCSARPRIRHRGSCHRATIGMPNMGGPIVTAGGLVFIGAATDNYLRAFDIDTGASSGKAACRRAARRRR